MPKSTRLLRLESAGGEGLYQSAAFLGSKLMHVQHTDVDMYQDGRRRLIEYRTRAGEKKTHYPARHPLTASMGIPIDLDSVIYATPKPPRPLQLGLDLGEPNESMDDLLNRLKERVLTGIFGSYVHPTLAYDSWRCIDDQQLTLDVDMPRRVIKHELLKGGNFTLADVLEMNHTQEYAQVFCSSGDNRPMPREDGIRVKCDRYRSQGYLFAFQTTKQMTDWLDGMTPTEVLNSGGVIRIVHARKAKHGRCQSVFRVRDVVKDIAISHKGYRKVIAPLLEAE